MDKELRLLPMGIKVLSLFFIDQVDRYRRYAGNEPQKGEYAAIFEEEYARLIARGKYAPVLAALPLAHVPDKAHEGYFSIDKKGRLKDTRGDTQDDQDAYALIMRDKERLLSFETPLRFIKLAGEEYSVQEIFGREELEAYLGSTAIPVEHSVYDHVIYDRSDTERRFAEALDADPDVKLFFKLPSTFKIDTPLGGYNPDWAVLIDTPEERRLYFVLETKGSVRRADLRDPEAIKIKCGEGHFEAVGGVGYAVADEWGKAKLGMI